MRVNRLFIISLILLEVLALLFRFWQLDKYPVSLTMDEVSLGYGSYSLFHTGRDEWGNKMPLAFYSVGDYKPPINYYLLAPVVGILGMNEWTERTPVALIGSLTALIFVVFLRHLGFSKWAAVAGGFWLAILPWHVYHSRFGIEAITASFFMLIGATYFIKSIRKRKASYLLLATLFAGLSVWSYHSSRVFVPLLTIFFVISNFQKLKLILSRKRSFLILGLIFSILAIPFLFLLIKTPAIVKRGAMTSILREPYLQRSLHYGNYSDFPQDRILNNDIYIIWHHWLGKYLNYYDFLFLFGNGLNLTSPGFADSGLMYFWDMSFILAGVVYLLRSQNSFLKKITLFWIFTGPLAASLATNEQHTLRSLLWFPAFGILWVSGVELLLSKRYLKTFVIGLFYIILIFFNVLYLKDLYTVQMPKFTSEFWGYGYKQAAVYACANQDKYDRLVIGSIYGSQGPLFTGIPDYYVLFYCQYNPAKYIATHKIEKFDFGKIDWQRELSKHLNTLLISAKWDFPHITPPENHVIKEFDYLNDLPAFYYVTTNPVKVD